MATKNRVRKKDSKERIESLRNLVGKSDDTIKNYAEVDMERSFEELHYHIETVANYCNKMIDEMFPLCKERNDKTGLLMLEEFRKDIREVLSERARRGTGILPEIQKVLEVARSTSDHLNYIHEVSIRIEGVVPLARKLEEIRSKLEEHYDAMPDDNEDEDEHGA